MNKEIGNSPRVSVILAAHGDAPWIECAINSIKAQSLIEWELICVLDDVTESVTRLVCGHQRDARIRIFVHQKNLGAAAARNVGLDKARGNLIAILDSDDEWSEDHLRNGVEFLEKHQGVALVGASYRVIDAYGSATGRVIIAPRMLLPRQLTVRNCFAHSSVIYRRSVAVRAGGYPLGVTIGEDYCLWLRIAGLGQIRNSRNISVNYRVHGDQTSRKPIDVKSSQLIREYKLELASIAWTPKWIVMLSHRLWLKRRNRDRSA